MLVELWAPRHQGREYWGGDPLKVDASLPPVVKKSISQIWRPADINDSREKSKNTFFLHFSFVDLPS